PGLFLRASATSPGFRTSTNQASLFVEDRLEVTDRLSLIAGARYEASSIRRDDLRNPANSFTKDFEAVSYRFGAVFN
ncbi:TonB-dependent receptor domain-containing protein, partial [Escherichia coli]